MGNNYICPICNKELSLKNKIRHEKTRYHKSLEELKELKELKLKNIK